MYFWYGLVFKISTINKLSYIGVILRRPKGEKAVHKRKFLKCWERLVIAIEAQKLLEQGCVWFLYNAVDTKTREPSLKDIPIVQEFLDVSPEEIQGKSSPGEVEFCIDLMLGATPISKVPYTMAPAELKDLKVQLDELLEKG